MREKDTDMRNLLIDAPTREQTCNLGVCRDLESNPQLFGLWDDAPNNWTTLARALE